MYRHGSTHNFLEWVNQKVTENGTADEIIEQLHHNQKACKQAATIAFQSGRRKLALEILEHEVNPCEQVVTLLNWSENTAAFVKAMECHNTDLIYISMLKIREKHTFEEFWHMIRSFPLAVTLYKNHCRKFNVQKLYGIYGQENNFTAQARTFMQESLVANACEAFRKARDHFNASLCQEHLKFLTYQKQLGEDFTGKSIHETCALLLKRDLTKAEEFKNEFKIPDRRFWWLRIQTLAELGNWNDLEQLSRVKKCPVGPELFVDACLSRNNKQEALKYLLRVREKLKVKYYIKVGFLEEAATMAFQKGDSNGLLLVKSICRSRPDLAEAISAVIKRIDKANCQMWHSFSL